MSADFVHLSSYMTSSSDKCLRTMTSSEFCFCLFQRGSDSFVNIEKASVKTLQGNYSEYPNWMTFIFTSEWKIAGISSEIVLNFVLLAHLERLPHPSFLCQYQVPDPSTSHPNSEGTSFFPSFSRIPNYMYKSKEDGDTSAIYTPQGKLRSKAS